MFKGMLKKSLIVTSVLLSLAATSAIAAEKRSYILTTASTGGTYYPVGCRTRDIKQD